VRGRLGIAGAPKPMTVFGFFQIAANVGRRSLAFFIP